MAMVDGQRLYDLNIEGPASERKKANIYKGKITRIEPSLEAAFVDYGADRHGFLPLKEVSSEYFVKAADSGKPNIKDVLKEGQDIVVQIDKEERGNKGAALTTFVSLAGRFIVLKPNKARSGGVSRRIVGSDRDLARDSLDQVEIPDNMSVILRTAGIDRSAEELEWDMNNLLQVWQAILDTVLKRPSPFLIYRESNAVIRALRDYLTTDIGEILIDDEATYAEAREFVEQIMPHNARKLKHYTDPVPLFTRFQIESQIESAFAHQVTLPSGGSIVIDHTEALVAIDVNSARATKGGDIEATALNTNLEAADEVARQLRIRDLGGLVVIDFIDMGPQKNQREVENRLRDAVRQDRARVQFGKITRFGLLEMSRQRLRPSIGESSYHSCPRCSGFGTIRSIESLALAILRLIGEEARKERTAKVIAQLPVEVATYLLNEKRDWVQSLESRNDTQVVLVANAHLETPHYDIRRVRDDQTELPENSGASYALAEQDPVAEIPPAYAEAKVVEQPAIGAIAPTTPAPVRQKEPSGFWVWLKGLFASDDDDGDDRRRKSASKQRRSEKAAGKTRGGKSKRGEQSSGRGRGRGGKAKGDGGRQSGEQRGKRKRKKSAQERQGKKAAGDKRQDTDNTPANNEQKPDEQKRSSRSRRSRGGRRRRRSAENADGNAQNASNGPARAESANDSANADGRTRESRGNGAKAPSSASADAPVKDAPARNEVKESAARPATTPKSDVAAPAKPETAKPETAKPETAKPAPAEKPKADAPAPAEKPKTDAPAPAAAKPAARKPAADKPASDGRQESRLLPWEPVPPPAAKPRDTAKSPGDSPDGA